MTSGHLPIRNSVVNEPGFLDEFDAKFPGEGLFAQNLENVTQGPAGDHLLRADQHRSWAPRSLR